ncbi:MAG: glutamate formimidoyltransferase [Acidobacteriota bacterium]|jgi:glutamate formiminotransferase/formiminotetrahydrofolate cyclodeaminase
MIDKIVECVPNFSEGRDSEKVELLIAAIRSVPGVVVLDAEMDADHHRSVITMAGEPKAIVEAAVRAAATAMELIDLTRHKGEHPRMGALDVLPFVPLRGVTMEECVGLARLAGRRIADELRIPVYFYEQAALRPERVDLANVRQGEFERLREEIVTDPKRHPDAGEARIHPTAGAIAVGARPPLIAYNINLGTDDLAVAKSIARVVRGRDGGLRYLKALAIDLRNRSQVQVSMNLVNYEATPLHQVFEMVRREAARYGVAITGSEIIGLVPQAAIDAAAEYYLQVENFSSELVLENRLAAELELMGTRRDVRSGEDLRPVPGSPSDEADEGRLGRTGVSELTLDEFAEEVASDSPTLAGGSVAAYAGALAAALAAMVSNVTNGRKSTPRPEQDNVFEQLQQLSGSLRATVSEEAEGRVSVLDAIALPRESEAERLARSMAIEEATRNAVAIPLRVVLSAGEVLELLQEMTESEATIALTDLTVAAQLALAALRGAACTVLSQLLMSADEEFNRLRRLELMDAMGRGQEIVHRIEKLFFTAYPI